MDYSPGDRVRLALRQRHPADPPVPVGTAGTVTERRESDCRAYVMETYAVAWDSGAISMEPAGRLAPLSATP